MIGCYNFPTTSVWLHPTVWLQVTDYSQPSDYNWTEWLAKYKAADALITFEEIVTVMIKLVLTYDPLEDRRINGVIVRKFCLFVILNKLIPCCRVFIC